jgi:uncharacterized membrane protein YfcA
VDLLSGVAIAGAGAAAGLVNAVVGSGTLITFPTLLALGYPPVTANVSNNIGLVLGGVSGSWGYRRELAGQRRRLARMAPFSALGAVAGALLLLWLPAEAFEAVVPVLIAVAVVLVVLQPRINAAVAAHLARAAGEPAEPGSQGTEQSTGHSTGHSTDHSTDHRAGHGTEHGARWVPVLVSVGTLLAGVYGGYFGAAQGVLLMGLLGPLLTETLQTVNGIKNVLSLVVNACAAVVFTVVAFDRVDWAVAGLIAAGSLAGGFVGAAVGRRLHPLALRAVVAVVGVVAIVSLLVS